MKRFTTGTVGSGKAIHAVHAHGEHKGLTACGKTAGTLLDGADAVTCKSCRNAVPSWGVKLSDEELAAIETEAMEQNAAVDSARRSVETADAVTAHQLRTAANNDAIAAEDWDRAHLEYEARQGGRDARDPEWNQTWRHRVTRDLVRVVNTALNDVQVRDMETLKRRWMTGEELRLTHDWELELGA